MKTWKSPVISICLKLAVNGEIEGGKRDLLERNKYASAGAWYLGFSNNNVEVI